MSWQEGFAARLPHLARFREAERLLMAQALVEAIDGRGAAASEVLLAGLRMAEHALQEPLLVAQLAGYAMIRTVTETAGCIGVAGRLPPGGAGPPESRGGAGGP